MDVSTKGKATLSTNRAESEPRSLRRLRIHPPELEREYREHHWAQNASRVRFVTVLLVVLMSLGLLGQGVSPLTTIAGKQEAFVFLGFAVLLTMAFVRRTRHLVTPTVAGFTIIVEVIMGTTVKDPGDYIGAPIDLMYAAIVIAALQSQFLLSVIFSVAMTFAWCFAFWNLKLGGDDMVPIVFGVVTLFFLCVSSYLNEIRDRRSFLFQKALDEERAKTQALIRNVLPPSIADRLAAESGVIAQHHESATVLFCDVVGFTPFAASKPPETVVGMLNDLFSRFDALLPKFQVEKIKTVGDCYMVAGGIPDYHADHLAQVADLALELRGTANAAGIDVRIGVHTGSVIAGVLGTERLMYDIWGPTVNKASRLESSADAGTIAVSREVKDLLDASHEFDGPFELELKGLGVVSVWHLMRRKIRDLSLS